MNEGRSRPLLFEDEPADVDSRVAVLVDFDGTASVRDVGGTMLRRFARDGSWRVIDEDYENGRIGSRAAYRIVEGLLAGSPEDWLRFALRRAELDPGLPALVALCGARGWHLEILSDGLDFYIEPTLRRAGLAVPFRANLLLSGDGRVRIATPHLNPRCGRCGTCKSERADALAAAGREIVYVGDGYSDFCVAHRAHRLFAKEILARHCRERGLPFEAYENLADVTRALAGPGA